MKKSVTYNLETAARICELIASGRSVKNIIANEPDMPSLSGFFKWLRDHPEFLDMYDVARELRSDFFAEEMLDIADDVSPDEVAKAKLRIDTRKWNAARMHPRKFGDKVMISGDQSAPIKSDVTHHVSDDFIEKAKAALNAGK